MLEKKFKKLKPCVIGLGYVGLPILLNLSSNYKPLGYDNSSKRISELGKGHDRFGEFTKKDLKKKNLKFSSDLKKLKTYNVFIITVPTPVLKNKKPDLSHIKDVCFKISKIIRRKSIIIFESTVYPGVTNNVCIPIIEKKSKYIEGKDFFVGYSPERVNPGDKKHNLKNIKKILSYPHNYKKHQILKLYSHLAKKIIISKNIKESETAKVIENIQRDVNIGLINEIYLVCNKLGINFNNVMNLASTKWNFLRFNPGLVGGHCLPVDPYYFAYVSKKNNIDTQITLAGRNTNNLMEQVFFRKAENIVKKLKDKKKIVICGLTYKKNVADLRNSLALNIYLKLKKKYKLINGYDPILNYEVSKKIKLLRTVENLKKFDQFIVLTAHDKLKKELNKLTEKNIIYLLK